jgi:hypothetical protein
LIWRPSSSSISMSVAESTELSRTSSSWKKATVHVETQKWVKTFFHHYFEGKKFWRKSENFEKLLWVPKM